MAGYANNSFKFVAVLNRTCPPARLFNALGHTTVGLTAGQEAQKFHLLDYPNKSIGLEAKISEYPYIILECKKSGWLENFYNNAKKENLLVNGFTQTMIGSSADEQISNTAKASAKQIEFIVVVVFGEASRIDPLTKKFSLWKNTPGQVESGEKEEQKGEKEKEEKEETK